MKAYACWREAVDGELCQAKSEQIYHPAIISS